MTVKAIIKKMKTGKIAINEGLVKIISAEIANGNTKRIPFYINVILPTCHNAEFLKERTEYSGQYDPANTAKRFEDIMGFLRSLENEALREGATDIVRECGVAKHLITFGKPYDWLNFISENWHFFSTSKSSQLWPETILRLSTPLTLSEEQMDLLAESSSLDEEQFEFLEEFATLTREFFKMKASQRRVNL